MAKHWESYQQILVESYAGSDRGHHGYIRVRPVSGQGFDISINVECSKKMRKEYPVGTRFLIFAKLTDREGGPPFLYSHHSWRYEVVQNSE